MQGRGVDDDRKYMFIESDTEAPREVPVDPAHVGRQIRDYETLGYRVSVVDSDERIRLGLLDQAIRRQQ